MGHQASLTEDAMREAGLGMNVAYLARLFRTLLPGRHGNYLRDELQNSVAGAPALFWMFRVRKLALLGPSSTSAFTPLLRLGF
jgi:hypothetical protein